VRTVGNALLIGVGLMFVSACGLARVKVPDDLRRSSEMLDGVIDDQGGGKMAIELGEYRAVREEGGSSFRLAGSGVSRTTLRRSSRGNRQRTTVSISRADAPPWLQAGRSVRVTVFRLETPAGVSYSGTCESVDRRVVQSLGCKFELGEGEEGTLAMERPFRGLIPPAPRGNAGLGGVTFALEATDRAQGVLAPYSRIMGYHLRVGDRTVAAVDIHHNTQVWLAADLPPAMRDLVMLIAAGLLLNDEWEHDPP
jgi:hypothetical protein